MTYTSIRRRIATLIAVRAVLGTLLLGSGTIAEVTAPGSFPVDPFFLLIALTYGLTIVWAGTLRFVDANPWLIDVQLAVDATIVTAFIYVTGGITSYFTSLYVLPIIAAAIIRHRGGAMLVASLSSLFYIFVVGAQYMSANGVMHDPFLEVGRLVLPGPRAAAFTVALNVFGFFIVALLAGSLSEGVRTAGLRLEVASSRIADLKALNQHVIDSLPSGLATTDPTLRILSFNRAAEVITGLSFPAVAGRRITEVLQLPGELVADFQRDLGGALLQSLFGALLTAGYAAAMTKAIGSSSQAASITESTQAELTKSFDGAASVAQQYPQYATQITTSAADAFTTGMNAAVLVALAMTLIGLALVIFVISFTPVPIEVLF